MSGSYRKERIERLVEELRYELTRGIVDREIPEALVYTFVIPMSQTYPRKGCVAFRMELFPVENIGLLGLTPGERRLKLVGVQDDRD
jgi:hypothetical protein